MGFTRVKSSEALRTHGTLEEAVESLFGDRNPGGKCLKTCPRVGKLRCHFTDVLVFELLYCFWAFRCQCYERGYRPTYGAGRRWQRGRRRWWGRVDRPTNEPSQNAADKIVWSFRPKQVEISVTNPWFRKFCKTVSCVCIIKVYFYMW